MRYLIIGSGAAGIEAAKTLRERAPEAEIEVFSVDCGAYARCMMHHYISGRRTKESLRFIPPDFWQTQRICHHEEEPVRRIFPEEHEIETEKGRYSYDRLLIASGSVGALPPIEGLRGAENVMGFRDLADAEVLKGVPKDCRVAVMGSGLVGMDVAYGLVERGVPTTIIGRAPRMIPRQTDTVTAGVYQKLFEEAGATFRLGKGVAGVRREGSRVTAVLLADDSEVPCDLLIAAVGVRPNAAFLEGSGIQVERGIVVNDWLETSAEHVYAAGDCTGLSGIWPAATAQGRAAAINMTGGRLERPEVFAARNSMNFFGVPMISVGSIPDEDREIFTLEAEGEYGIAAVRDRRLLGVHRLGTIDHGGIWEYLIRHEIQADWNAQTIFHADAARFYAMPQELSERRKMIAAEW